MLLLNQKLKVMVFFLSCCAITMVNVEEVGDEDGRENVSHEIRLEKTSTL